MHSAKEWAIRLAMVAISTVVTLTAAEAVSRWMFPISDGRYNVTLDGTPIDDWFVPGSVYRQLSNEYDAVTTITDKGHRVPGAEGNADVIFLGDSFTYGWGLTDEESFAMIYCRRLRLECANIARPGIGTLQAMVRLEQYLTQYDWRPREVKLFFFGMSSSFSAGNDFVDNYYEGRRDMARGPEPAPPVEVTPGLIERVIGLQGFLLNRSNLVRLSKYHVGPLLRSLVVADPGNERMTEALTFTRIGMDRFEALSREYGFDYQIYLIVPVQDIIRGTHPETLATLETVTHRPVHSTAPLFLDRPQQYYFSYDGHINALGASRIAEFLIEKDAASPRVHE